MKNISLSISTCPNDTFMFYALLNKKIDSLYRFSANLTDIEDLNHMAIKGMNDVTKISFAAYLNLIDDYLLLNSGAALGKGCGPIVVLKEDNVFSDLKNKKIAIPGINTTAALLIRLYGGQELNLFPMPFYEIMPKVRSGEMDLGVVIHEGRFTYQNYGLKLCLDLGKWWEDSFLSPIPLGGIAVKRSLAEDIAKDMEALISESILYSFQNREDSREYIKKFAREMDDIVIDEHIRLYVNDFSINLGDEGRTAIMKLYEKSVETGLVKEHRDSFFL